MTRKLNGSTGTYSHVIKGFHVNPPKAPKSTNPNQHLAVRTGIKKVKVNIKELPWSVNKLYPKATSPKYTYSKGMKVVHVDYGSGVITDVYSDNTVRVKFDNRDRGAKMLKATKDTLIPLSVAIYKAKLRNKD